jgi:hypothetical protein
MCSLSITVPVTRLRGLSDTWGASVSGNRRPSGWKDETDLRQDLGGEAVDTSAGGTGSIHGTPRCPPVAPTCRKQQHSALRQSLAHCLAPQLPGCAEQNLTPIQAPCTTAALASSCVVDLTFTSAAHVLPPLSMLLC